MLSSLAIKKFRCFRELKLGSTTDSLPRFNVIIGRNNCGKTALLESIFLLTGATNPELAVRLNTFRGMSPGISFNSPEEAWGWLFFDRQVQDDIEIVGTHGTKRKESLSMRLVEPQTTTESRNLTKRDVPQPVSTTTAVRLRELRFELRVSKGQAVVSRSIFVPGGKMEFQSGKSIENRIGVFLGTNVINENENVARFSVLAQESGRLNEIIEALQSLEPRVTRLELLMTAAGPVIHADVGLSRLIPLPFLGDGITRVLTVLLAVATVPGGTILIDEIETGLHHSVLPSFWKTIAIAARRANVQLFATTHSHECVAAAHEAFNEDHQDDLLVHRLERRDSGEIVSVSFDREALATALELGWEVR